jgi:hypothetical protein
MVAEGSGNVDDERADEVEHWDPDILDLVAETLCRSRKT